jgi:hypothetical protein
LHSPSWQLLRISLTIESEYLSIVRYLSFSLLFSRPGCFSCLRILRSCDEPVRTNGWESLALRDKLLSMAEKYPIIEEEILATWWTRANELTHIRPHIHRSTACNAHWMDLPITPLRSFDAESVSDPSCPSEYSFQRSQDLCHPGIKAFREGF